MAKLIKGVNDLATVHPELVEEWDYEKNDLMPEEVSYSSHKKMVWICPKKKHSYSMRIDKRHRGHGCPYCSGRLPILGETDLLTVHPEFAEEWDYERNKKRPEEYSFGSGEKVHWLCWKERHPYEARINDRNNGGGCPYCNGRLLILGETDLLTVYPELAEEWDYEQNEKGPEDYCPTSHEKVHWICKREGHPFEATISNRSRGSKCPYCSGRLPIRGKTDLLTKAPELAEEWDYERNKKRPEDYCFASNTKVYWLCSKENHSFIAGIDSRYLGTGCPYCAGILPILGKTDLLTVHPELAKEWDYERNEKGPEEYSFGSDKKVHWLCWKEKHPYMARIKDRNRGKGCPYCAGILPIPGKTDLLTVHPELAEEWDYERNKKGPEEYSYGSKKKVHWLCWKEKHPFIAEINSRHRGSGCPYCSNRRKIKSKKQIIRKEHA